MAKANPEVRTKWERRIADFRSSGLSQTKWCDANDIKINQLKYWLRKIEGSPIEQKPSNRWVSVAIEEKQNDFSDTLQIRVGHATVDVKLGFHPSLLAEVVKTLQKL